jgi:hypothetical protein
MLNILHREVRRRSRLTRSPTSPGEKRSDFGTDWMHTGPVPTPRFDPRRSTGDGGDLTHHRQTKIGTKGRD